MSLRNVLLITAVTMGSLSAQTPQSNAVPTITRTYLFPMTGLATGPLSHESARIVVVNIAQNAHNGTKASCDVKISFTNEVGTQMGTPVTVTGLGAGKVAKGDVSGDDPTDPNDRGEVQGSVQVTTGVAPCTLLLTLEVFDSTSGQTHAILTNAFEQPAAVVVGLHHD